MCGPSTVHNDADGSGRDSYVNLTSGGMHAGYRDCRYREAFKKSLRQIERPQSAYVKYGGKQTGMKKTADTYPQF